MVGYVHTCGLPWAAYHVGILSDIRQMKVASIDPGGRSGLVIIEYLFRSPAHLTVSRAMVKGTLLLENVNGKETAQVEALYRKVKGCDVVIIEDYIIRVPLKTTARKALSPVRIGFGVDLLLGMSPKFSGQVIWQQPSDIGVITDDRLRAWGLWLPGQINKDIRAAMKHLIIYLRGHPRV